jgi:hypothetical protein
MGPRKTNRAGLGFVADMPGINGFKRSDEGHDRCNYHGDGEECDCGPVASPIVIHDGVS